MRCGLAIAFVLCFAATCGVAGAETKDTRSEEATCKEIGFRPKTVAFGDCVLELLSRKEAGGQIVTSSPLTSSPPSPSQTSRRAARLRNTTSKSEPVIEVALTPNEQICAGYGFKKGTTQFGQCLMQLDDAQRQAELQQQQYQLQLAQYQHELTVYEAQQKAIKEERDRRKWAMIGRLGAGMANSTSPSFLGALNEGLAAANGVPISPPVPVAPQPPASQNYTIRLPSGNQVYCNYNSFSGYMSCR